MRIKRKAAFATAGLFISLPVFPLAQTYTIPELAATSGEKRFCRQLLRAADVRFDAHLARLNKEDQK